jgi:HPr kinase/phosphorylase
MCERAQIPMFATHESSAFVIDVLRAYLSKHFADRAPCMAYSWTFWAWAS